MALLDDFTIKRNEDGSDFTITPNEEKTDKEGKKKPKQSKPGNKNRTENTTKKPAGNRKEKPDEGDSRLWW